MTKKRIHDYFTRKHMLSSNYEVFHFLNTEDTFQYLHTHDFYEFYLYISGDVTYLIEGKSYNLESGDMIFINTKELHWYGHCTYTCLTHKQKISS